MPDRLQLAGGLRLIFLFTMPIARWITIPDGRIETITISCIFDDQGTALMASTGLPHALVVLRFRPSCSHHGRKAVWVFENCHQHNTLKVCQRQRPLESSLDVRHNHLTPGFFVLPLRPWNQAIVKCGVDEKNGDTVAAGFRCLEGPTSMSVVRILGNGSVVEKGDTTASQEERVGPQPERARPRAVLVGQQRARFSNRSEESLLCHMEYVPLK